MINRVVETDKTPKDVGWLDKNGEVIPVILGNQMEATFAHDQDCPLYVEDPFDFGTPSE